MLLIPEPTAVVAELCATNALYHRTSDGFFHRVVAFGAGFGVFLDPVDVVLFLVQQLLPSGYILTCGWLMGIFSTVKTVLFST
jgi:hypothetical protein